MKCQLLMRDKNGTHGGRNSGGVEELASERSNLKEEDSAGEGPGTSAGEGS